MRIKAIRKNNEESHEKDRSFPALKLKQNDHVFYFASIPVKDIFPYCFIKSRSEDPIQGFQRNLSQSRADDIANYIDTQKGSIPTNVVLSAQDTAQFTYDSSKKTVRYKPKESSFLVIDGQHRLYGYSRSKKINELRIPVAIYENLDRSEEARLFIDINTNQKGVPAALLLDIKQLANQEQETESELRFLFDYLSQDKDSPFKGSLSAFESKSGKISRVTFNRGTELIIKSKFISSLSQEKRKILIRNYFKAISEHLLDSSLLLKSVYFEAFCDYFETIISKTKDKHSKLKLEDLSDYLKKLDGVRIQDSFSTTTTKVKRGNVIAALKIIFDDRANVSDDMV